MPIATPPAAGKLPFRQPVRSKFMGVRYAIIAFAPLALASGLAGGLWRLGWALPGGDRLALLHGPLMISGLFGTLISLERAVALGKGWAYAAPALSALATAMLLAGAPAVFAASFYLAAAAVLVAVAARFAGLAGAFFGFWVALWAAVFACPFAPVVAAGAGFSWLTASFSWSRCRRGGCGGCFRRLARPRRICRI